MNPKWRMKAMVMPPAGEVWEGGPLIVNFGRGRLDPMAMTHAQKADALCFVGGDEVEYWIAGETAKVDVEEVRMTRIPDKDWAAFRSRFINMGTTVPALAFIKLLVEAGVPLCNDKVSQILTDDSNHWRAAVADMVYERDMRKFEAIVLVHKDKDKKGEPVVVPRWIPHQHMKKSWFAFTNLDDAMSVKFSFPKSTLIEL